MKHFFANLLEWFRPSSIKHPDGTTTYFACTVNPIGQVFVVLVED